MPARFHNPEPRPNDPVSAADFAELVRWVQRLANTTAPRSIMDQTGLHLRPRLSREPFWVRITSHDEQTNQYGWIEQHVDGHGFADRPGGRTGTAGGSQPAFETNGAGDVQVGSIVQLQRVGQSSAYVFNQPASFPPCDPQSNVLSVVTDIVCNGDGTISVTRRDICVREILD